MTFMGRGFLLFVLFAVSVGNVANAQGISLAIGSAAAAPGTSTTLNLSMTATGGAQPDGVQWSLGYSVTDVSSIAVSAGAAATGAGKSLACSNGTGNVTCLLYGVNSAVIANGVIAQIAVTLASGTQSASSAIQISGAVAANGAGNAITTTGSSGALTITQSSAQPALSTLTCAGSTITTTGNVSCTVSLTALASVGFPVTLSSSNSQLRVPGSVSVSAGSTTASFAATASGISTAATAVITASAGTVSRTASITLSTSSAAPTVRVSSLACSPATISSGSSTTCTVSLLGTAPAAGFPVSLSSGNSAIRVPSSVTVASGATTATFQAQASGTMAAQVWITSSENGFTAQAMVTVSALQIQGSPSEVSGWSNGATVTPSSAPIGFTGKLAATGNGQVSFAAVGAASGVSFATCCTNTNTAYYTFTGANLGSLFNLTQGQISFNLKSSYSFAQRQTTAASPRYVFDVLDNAAAGHHLFYFFTEYTSNSLTFGYMIEGVNQFYYVPHGSENQLFGNGTVLGVTLSWSNGVANLYLNGTLVKSTPFTAPAATWTSGSTFNLGALSYLTYGGYDSCDDVISGFAVGIPSGQ